MNDTASTVLIALQAAKLILDFVEVAQGMSEEEAKQKWAELQQRLQSSNEMWERAGS